MMNSTDCCSKTPPVPTRTPWREKSSRHKGLMRGHSPRHPRPSQTSRSVRAGITWPAGTVYVLYQ